MTEVSTLLEYSDSDAAEISQLITQLSSKFDGTPIPRKRLINILSSPYHDQLVVREEGHIIGIATLSVTMSVGANSKVWLEDFVVDVNHRGKGVADLLWQFILNECRKRNAILQFTSNTTRVAAHNFYIKHGATIRDTVTFEYKEK